MEHARSGLRARLAEHPPLFGIYVNFASPAIVELAGHAGYDWVFIDAELGALDMEMCEHMVRAAESAAILPMVRLPMPDPRLVGRYLDTGAVGILIPHVASASVAQSMVEAGKFYPLGRRGAGNTRAAQYGYGRSAAEYAAWANRETVLFGMIEDEAALAALPEILSVEGLDGFVVGPSDLSHSMGVPGQITHRKVLRAVEHVTQLVLNAGKLLCLNLMSSATAIDDAKRLSGMHVPMIAEAFGSVFARGARDVVRLKDGDANRPLVHDRPSRR